MRLPLLLPLVAFTIAEGGLDVLMVMRQKGDSRRWALCLLIALTFGDTGGQMLFAATFHFSAAGNDQTGDGTEQHPWRSVNKFNALNLNPGDQALFRAGDLFVGSLYLDQDDTGVNAFGELVAPITLGTYGSGGAGRATFRSASSAAGFLAYNNGGIELKNLEFVNGGSYASNPSSGVQFYVDQNSSSGLTHLPHLRVENVSSHGFQRSGLALDAGGNVGYKDIEIRGGEFYDNQFAGVSIGGANWTDLLHQDLRIEGVVARDNPGFAGCSPHCGHGVVIGQTDGAVVANSTANSNGLIAGKGNVGIWTWQSNAVRIERNVAYGNRSPNGADGGGFDIDGGVTNSIVQYNRSYDNAGAGYLLAEFGSAEPMQQNVFRYNLSVNDGSDGYGAITIWGEDSASIAASALIHNNTVVVDQNVAPNSRGAVWFVNNNHNEIDLINNVFVALHGANLIEGAVSADQAKFTNNAYWTAGAPLRISGQTYVSVSQWATGTQQETIGGVYVGLEANPFFSSDGTYKLVSPSPLIDAGLPLNGASWPNWFATLGARDLYGVSVPQQAAADLGAAEYVRSSGDYNGNGVVDAADYVVWRESIGMLGVNLIADGNHNGMVDADDYLLWKGQFGQPMAAAAGVPAGTAAIPEPVAMIIALVVVNALGHQWALRRRYHPKNANGVSDR